MRGKARLAGPISRLLGLGAALLTALAFAGTTDAGAVVEVPFATQFASNGHGDVTVVANTLMTCPEAAANCPAARAGTATGAALNNNGYVMEPVDVDGEAGTFDSSTATLALPAGATVTFAGLYYGARTSKGTGLGAVAAPEPAARGTILFRAPGQTYVPLSAAVNDSSGIAAAYTGFVDVTAQVAAAGAGQYTVANVQTGTGEDRYAGWGMIVVYSDPAAPPRSIRVFGGLASIVQKAPPEPLQIPITGLETPPAGSVSADVALVAYEGDRGSAGDALSLAGKNLSDAANPANNIFNSSISIDGVDVAEKNPNYVDQLGFDADLIEADGFLGNEATEAVLEESTNVEQYLTQAVAVSIELDPEALEPPPPLPAPPPTPVPPSTEAPPPSKGKHEGEGHRPGSGHPHEPTSPREPAAVEVSIPPAPETVRPTAVVPLRVTVESSGAGPVQGLSVCSRVSPGLTRLRAVGASPNGSAACWHLVSLASGKRRTFVATARVDADARGELTSTTVVRAKNARRRVRRTSFRVAPLPQRACGSSLWEVGRPIDFRC